MWVKYQQLTVSYRLLLTELFSFVFCLPACFFRNPAPPGIFCKSAISWANCQKREEKKGLNIQLTYTSNQGPMSSCTVVMLQDANASVLWQHLLKNCIQPWITCRESHHWWQHSQYTVIQPLSWTKGIYCKQRHQWTYRSLCGVTWWDCTVTLHRNFVKDLVDVSPNKLAYLIKGTGFRSAALNTRGLFYQSVSLQTLLLRMFSSLLLVYHRFVGLDVLLSLG